MTNTQFKLRWAKRVPRIPLWFVFKADISCLKLSWMAFHSPGKCECLLLACKSLPDLAPGFHSGHILSFSLLPQGLCIWCAYHLGYSFPSSQYPAYSHHSGFSSNLTCSERPFLSTPTLIVSNHSPSPHLALFPYHSLEQSYLCTHELVVYLSIECPFPKAFCIVYCSVLDIQHLPCTSAL